jgi:hypothetical protein
MREQAFIMTNPDYKEGLLIQEYNGVISINSGRQFTGKDGSDQVVPKFCLPERGYQKFADKPIPLGVRLGDIFEAKEYLERCIKFLDTLAGAQTEEQITPPPWEG